MESVDAAIVQRAAEWMARLWSGEASDMDRADCAAWRQADARHELAWQGMQQFETRLHCVPTDVARQALQAPPDGAFVTRRRALHALGLAAITGGAAWLVRGTDEWQLATAEYRTAMGEVRELTLPDGSRLVLASASAVDLRFTQGERLIVLRAGEILVASAPDPLPAARPLRVLGRHGTVQALGTRFTVRQLGHACRIAVFDGAIELRPADAPGMAVRVNSGYGTSFTARRVAGIAPVRESAAAWRQGLLVADDMRLDELLAELARYRQGLLRCAPDVAGLRVSGIFSLRDSDRALHNLGLALPVTVHYRTRYWATVTARPDRKT